jgi:hypothetical protein
MRRRPLWKLIAAVALSAALLGLCIVPAARISAYSRLYRQLDDRVRALNPSDPLLVDPAAWDCAHGWAVTALANVCFSPEHVGFDEMRRLSDDLDVKLRGQVDLKALAWLWDRLGTTGPHGKEYTDTHRGAFFSCIPGHSAAPK